MNQQFEKLDMLQEVSDFLSTPLPEDWNTWPLPKRREFWLGDRRGGCVPRRTVCALEIWKELLGLDDIPFTQSDARQINKVIAKIPGWKGRSCVNCGALYGNQRGFRYMIL